MSVPDEYPSSDLSRASAAALARLRSPALMFRSMPRLAATRIEVLPSGWPVFLPCRKRYHELRDGHGVVVDGVLYCTDADEAKAREMLASGQ